MVGVASSTFNDWVKGKKYPRIDKIEMLANFFRIQKSDLIEDKTDENGSPSNAIYLADDERLILDLYDALPQEKKDALINMARLLKGK